MTDQPTSASTAHVSGDEYVSLLDRLVTLAEHLPVSHVIADGKVGRFVSALAHYTEHGIDLLDAADATADRLRAELHLPTAQRTGASDVPAVLTAPYPDSPADPTAADARDREIAALRAELAQTNDRIAALSAQRPEPEGYVPPTVPEAETTVSVEPAPVDPSDPSTGQE